MSRKTVQKHIGALVDKGLAQTEETTIRRKNGFVYNGSLLYTFKPIQRAMREREKEFLAELKLAAAQREWAQRAAMVKVYKPPALRCKAVRTHLAGWVAFVHL